MEQESLIYVVSSMYQGEIGESVHLVTHNHKFAVSYAKKEVVREADHNYMVYVCHWRDAEQVEEEVFILGDGK